MNIVLNAHMVDIDLCIKFLDTKRNNIMDGKFTKLLYSDEYASFNGLYVLCPLTRIISNSSYKNNFAFHPNMPNNSQTIQQLVQLEKQLITFYKQYNACNKKHVFSLQNQLHSGIIKIYQDIVKSNSSEKQGINYGKIHTDSTKIGNFCNDVFTLNETQSFYVIKISGIWETSDTIGITYKFLEMYR